MLGRAHEKLDWAALQSSRHMAFCRTDGESYRFDLLSPFLANTNVRAPGVQDESGCEDALDDQVRRASEKFALNVRLHFARVGEYTPRTRTWRRRRISPSPS